MTTITDRIDVLRATQIDVLKKSTAAVTILRKEIEAASDIIQGDNAVQLVSRPDLDALQAASIFTLSILEALELEQVEQRLRDGEN